MSKIDLIAHPYDLGALQAGYADFIQRWSGGDDAEFTDGRFHASDLGKCVRQAVLKRAGKKHRPYDEDELAMFAEANFIHAGMTNFWMKAGLGIAREHRMTDEGSNNWLGWSGKFDLWLHNPVWCGCGVLTNTLAIAFKEMVARKQDGTDWKEWAQTIAKHQTFMLSLKSVHPNGLKFYTTQPAYHHVCQDSWYCSKVANEFGVPMPDIIIMYRSRGGSATPIFHFVESLAAGDIARVYGEAYDDYLLEGTLPEVLPLVVKQVADKTYGQVLVLEQSWECGYCRYANWSSTGDNFCCIPHATTNQKQDRIAVVKPDTKEIVLVQEWIAKGNQAIDVSSMVADYIRDAGMRGWVMNLVMSPKAA